VYCTFIQIHELIPENNIYFNLFRSALGLDRISNNECESTNHNSSNELQISRSLKFSNFNISILSFLYNSITQIIQTRAQQMV